MCSLCMYTFCVCFGAFVLCCDISNSVISVFGSSCEREFCRHVCFNVFLCEHFRVKRKERDVAEGRCQMFFPFTWIIWSRELQ